MIELARRYAGALFALTEEEETVSATADDLLSQQELWAALNSPVLRAAEKKAVLSRLPTLAGEPVLLHFYQLLCDKGRMGLLPEILEAYHALALDAKAAAVCRMTCVHIPDEARQTALKAMLCRLHHKREVRLDIRVDPALLGGFLLEIEGVSYDRSVRSQLKGLERQLQERRIV